VSSYYEIAGYSTVIACAEEPGESKHIALLNETLEEEKETDEKLTGLAGDINAQTNQGQEVGEEDAAPKKQSRNAE
jgi:ferritin-like metal-binding protein YciE